MKKIKVTVRIEQQSKEYQDARRAFWDSFSRVSGNGSNSDFQRGDFADRLERRLRNQLPLALHDALVHGLAGARESFPGEPRVRDVEFGRLILTIEAITYDSMTIDLGIPDIDAFIELLGNNSEVFEAVFGAYVPRAFNNALPGDTSLLDYQIDIPKDVREYIDTRKVKGRKKITESGDDAKEKGTAILLGLIQSPLILPILLICFLWYYARQDMLEERRVTDGLIQTLVTEQTAVIGLLKDKQSDAGKEHTSTARETTTTNPAASAKPKSEN